MTAAIHRRHLLIAAAAACASPLGAMAQGDWPQRPVRLIVPAAPGGASDRLARLLVIGLGRVLGQPVIVDNRAGAGGVLGTGIAAKSAADGYTLLFTGAFNVINPGLYARLPYDYVEDFDHVAPMTQGPNVLVTRPDFQAATLTQLVELARSKPGALDFASGGNGTSGHLTMEIFQRAAGIKLNHVAYKGAAPALQDVLAGVVPMIALNQDTALPYLKAGKLRALAVSSARRNAALPEVPTFAEAGNVDVVVTSWAGVDAPRGTPPAVVARLAAAVAESMKMPAIKGPLDADGWVDFQAAPRDFDAFVRKESARWARVIQAAGIRAES